jgi:hypothetical protein
MSGPHARSSGMGARLRASAALSAAALALHQARYLAAHGDAANAALSREGHGYLDFAGPLLALLGALALAQLAVAWQRRLAPRSRPTFGRLWTVAACGLLAIFVVQESLEGVLSAGHASGVAAVFGSGGWVALPLGAGLGLAVAFVLRSADALLAARARNPGGYAPPTDALCPDPTLNVPPAGVLALHLAGRAPPLVTR